MYLNNKEFGELAYACGGNKYKLRVCHSAAGYYIGTVDEDHLPNTRESVEYWRRRETAVEALKTGDWLQRDHL